MGGFWTFYSPLPVIGASPPYTLPVPLPPGPKITIQGIHFEGALWAPIHIAYTSGANVSGNRITSVVPYGPGPFDPSFPDFKYLNAGILCGTFFAQTGVSPGKIYREGAVTGLVNINKNYIDLENSQNSHPENTLSQGIFLNWTTGIMAKISDNIIKNVSRNSIEVLDNYLANRIGMIVMEGNEITTPEVGIRLSEWVYTKRDCIWLVFEPCRIRQGQELSAHGDAKFHPDKRRDLGGYHGSGGWCRGFK